MSFSSIEKVLALNDMIGEIDGRFSCSITKRWSFVPRHTDLIPEAKQDCDF